MTRDVTPESRKGPAHEFRPLGGANGRYEGFIEVSDRGQVRVRARSVPVGRYGSTRRIGERVLPTRCHAGSGRLTVRLPEITIDGKTLAPRVEAIAELVWDAWRQPGALGFDGIALGVQHLDGDPCNVAPTNLARRDERQSWRPLPEPGYEQLFEVSAAGVVRNVRTGVVRRTSTDKRTGQPMLRLHALLGGSDHEFSRRLDMLVALAWCERPGGAAAEELGLEHLDANPENCTAENLLWVDAGALATNETLPTLEFGDEFRPTDTGDRFVDAHHLISRHGVLWSRPRLSRPFRKGQRAPLKITGGTTLEPYLNSCGYPAIGISVPGRGKPLNFTIHELVGGAFIGQRTEELPQYDHLDGDRTNARADNLELVTSRENNARRSRPNARRASLRSPEGRRVELHGVTRYANHLRLDVSNLQRLIDGKTRGVYGWTLWDDGRPLVDPALDIDFDPDDWRVPVVDTRRVKAEEYRVNPLGEIVDTLTGEALESEIVQTASGKTPYRKVRMRTQRSSTTEFVHRLVARTFHDNTERKPVVDHVNRYSLDNRAVNLRFATVAENNANIRVKRPSRVFVSPDGVAEIVLDGELEEWSLKRQLDPRRMRDMHAGHLDEHCEWRRPTNGELDELYALPVEW